MLHKVLGRTVQVGAVVLLEFVIAAAVRSPAMEGRFDGPAELPRVYVRSALADTPAPGKSLVVKSSKELAAALDNASCGDTIKLQAGTEFAGAFKFPAKPCDDAHWIIVRTSAEDSDLPPEGTRITPCYAGVASLPGRPEYPCSTPGHAMARIIFDGKGSNPVTFLSGANHYRLIGLEITRGSPGICIYYLAGLPKDGTTHHVIFDRVWMHGTAQDETTRGIALGDGQHVAVVDSYLSDFHCVAVTGTCTDAQAISGGLSTHEGGPYKIVNNFLEAAGQGVMFGGGAATASPADIEIRHNYFFKPLTWRLGNPGFVGGTSGKPFIVKNHFELKNAQRVLLEGNVLDNVWGGFSQTGFAILLTAKNQNNLCPACRVTDVTIRYDLIRHCASGFQIATGLSDAGGASSGTERISIHDVILEDIGGDAYAGFGALAQISSTRPTLRDLSIDHVTAFPPKALFIFGAPAEGEHIVNFTFTNSLVGVGIQDIFPTGGGERNCAFQPKRQTYEGVLKSCFNGSKVSHNLFLGSRGVWPKENLYASDLASAGVVLSGEGRYRLCRAKEGECKKASPAIGKGSDGRNIGADVQQLLEEIKGAE
ncbi:MAG TPA: hypothetical protein VK466_13765 [Terriglobales bacterium]|nr:hypothetical protein [Terriglobales bacterium]